MKKFVCILKDKTCDDMPQPLVKRHVDHLKQCALDGHLFLCGPLLGHGGAMQIINADTKEEVVVLLEKDPFLTEGLYAAYDLYELLEANLENNFLYKE